MVRDRPLDQPSIDEVIAAADVLGENVDDVTRIEEGLNAIYRIDFGGGGSAILKAATLATDAELLSEPYLLSRVDRSTDVPVPGVLTIVEPDDGPLDTVYFVSTYCEGRQVTDILTLSPVARERLVREMGHHLASIHEMRVVDDFGSPRVNDGFLVVDPQYESWASWFAELSMQATDGLLGEGYITDSETRFADLEPTIRRALATIRPVIGEQQITPAILHGDNRPANLVLALEDDADPIITAVLDFGDCQTGDGLLDLALAEDALVDIPLGGTERADCLRSVLRSAYAEGQDVARDVLFDDRYPYYRLYARTRRLGSFGYMNQFAREDDTDEIARRWRSFVRERLSEIDPSTANPESI